MLALLSCLYKLDESMKTIQRNLVYTMTALGHCIYFSYTWTAIAFAVTRERKESVDLL
jgi:preprotein translocase subunit SecY